MYISEFQREYNDKSYLIEREVMPATYIYGLTLEDIELIERGKEYPWIQFAKKSVKWKIDPIDKHKLWLYKNDSIGLIIDEMYKLPCEAKEAVTSIILGFSADEVDKRLSYTKKHKKELSDYQISDTVYQFYFPDRKENVEKYRDVDEEYDEDEVSEDMKEYLDELKDPNFVCNKNIASCDM